MEEEVDTCCLCGNPTEVKWGYVFRGSDSPAPTMPEPPKVGEVGVLVHVECVCGYYVGMPEGASYPVCPHCGGRCVPGGGPSSGPPMYGDSNAEARRMRSCGYVAFLTSEMGAARLVSKARGFLGLLDEWGPVVDRGPRNGRLYTEREVAAKCDELDDRDSEPYRSS